MSLILEELDQIALTLVDEPETVSQLIGIGVWVFSIALRVSLMMLPFRIGSIAKSLSNNTGKVDK